VEDTFRNVKQFLGAEEPQSWKDIAPERAGAFSYLLYGVVWLSRLEREGKVTASLEREWYQEKPCVFSVTRNASTLNHWVFVPEL
jgi:hypothetical protein